MDNDPFTMQTLKLIAVFDLIVVAALGAVVVLWLIPKVRIWREKFAIWRRDNRTFREELAQRRRKRDAWRLALLTPVRRHKPMICLCCGGEYDTVSQLVTHRCTPSQGVQ